jgi:hypothetical protein
MIDLSNRFTCSHFFARAVLRPQIIYGLCVLKMTVFPSNADHCSNFLRLHSAAVFAVLCLQSEFQVLQYNAFSNSPDFLVQKDCHVRVRSEME